MKNLIKIIIVVLILVLFTSCSKENQYVYDIKSIEKKSEYIEKDTLSKKDSIDHLKNIETDFENFNHGEFVYDVNGLFQVKANSQLSIGNAAMIYKTDTKLGNVLIASSKLDPNHPTPSISGGKFNMKYSQDVKQLKSFMVWDPNKMGGYYMIRHQDGSEELHDITPKGKKDHYKVNVKLGKYVVYTSIVLNGYGGIDDIKGIY